MVLESLGPLLERSGFHVLSASNGEEALRKVQSHRPDVIVSTFPATTTILGCLRLRGCSRQRPSHTLDGDAARRAPLARGAAALPRDAVCGSLRLAR